jgi:hypothetical protein
LKERKEKREMRRGKDQTSGYYSPVKEMICGVGFY